MHICLSDSERSPHKKGNIFQKCCHSLFATTLSSSMRNYTSIAKVFLRDLHLFVVSVRVDSCTIWCEPQLYVHNTALSSLWKAHAMTRTTNDLHTANWLRVDFCKEHESWRQCKFPRAEVMFFTIQRENIRPSKNKMNKALTMLKLPDVCS
jgi:hypothetical protein